MFLQQIGLVKKYSVLPKVLFYSKLELNLIHFYSKCKVYCKDLKQIKGIKGVKGGVTVHHLDLFFPLKSWEKMHHAYSVTRCFGLVLSLLCFLACSWAGRFAEIWHPGFQILALTWHTPNILNIAQTHILNDLQCTARLYAGWLYVVDLQTLLMEGSFIYRYLQVIHPAGFPAFAPSVLPWIHSNPWYTVFIGQQCVCDCLCATCLCQETPKRQAD